MATADVQARSAPRAPWVVWLGLAVVLAAAAVLSFDALRALALAVGIPAGLAWLLPVAVDAGAAVSCAVWLGRRAAPDASRFAGRMTWALLAVTVFGNAGQLGMHAHGVTPPWWVAVLVGAIPPAVVGSTVHLVVLLVRTDRTAVDRLGPDGTADRTAGPLTLQQPDHDDEPGEWADPWERWSTPDEDPPQTTGPAPDPLLAEAVQWAVEQDRPVSQRALRERFGIGAGRAKRLHDALEVA